ARFSTILEFATGEAWKLQKDSLPAELEDDEKVAIETGIANGLRQRLFGEIERATRLVALPQIQAGDATTTRASATAVEKLEHAVGLLRVNLNEASALETFLLGSLRIWTRR